MVIVGNMVSVGDVREQDPSFQDLDLHEGGAAGDEDENEDQGLDVEVEDDGEEIFEIDLEEVQK